ncbi:MAG: hypothetical protein ACI837_000164 [Crocinitomicaceae bacterium]|jgi:hypothetical protein
MKKVIISTLAIAALMMVSCNKEKVEQNFLEEISQERAQITLPDAGYDIVVTDALVSSDAYDYYTDGRLDYVLDGEILASVDFGNGPSDSQGMCSQNGSDKPFDKHKHDCKFKGKKSKFDRIIVRPIVRTDGCAYIVSGIVKLIDRKTDKWIATIDFGDGTCDDIATKTTKDGTHVFHMSDFH